MYSTLPSSSSCARDAARHYCTAVKMLCASSNTSATTAATAFTTAATVVGAVATHSVYTAYQAELNAGAAAASAAARAKAANVTTTASNRLTLWTLDGYAPPRYCDSNATTLATLAALNVSSRYV
jgi:hypothetical protein